MGFFVDKFIILFKSFSSKFHPPNIVSAPASLRLITHFLFDSFLIFFRNLTNYFWQLSYRNLNIYLLYILILGLKKC